MKTDTVKKCIICNKEIKDDELILKNKDGNFEHVLNCKTREG